MISQLQVSTWWDAPDHQECYDSDDCEDHECGFMDDVHPNIAANTLAACHLTNELFKEEGWGVTYFNYDECMKVAMARFYDYDDIKQEYQGDPDDRGTMTYQASGNAEEEEEMMHANNWITMILWVIALLVVVLIGLIVGIVLLFNQLQAKEQYILDIELTNVAA